MGYNEPAEEIELVRYRNMYDFERSLGEERSVWLVGPIEIAGTKVVHIQETGQLD